MMDKATLTAASDRLFADMAGAMTAGLCYVGTIAGLFRAMAGKGPLTHEQVVRESGLQPRYVEEWLKGMTCAGYLDYDPAGATFSLPDELAYFLASDGTDHFLGGIFAMTPVLLRAAPKVAQAFEHGGGVAFEDYGRDGVIALDLINRGQYEHRFAGYWLKTLPDVVKRLESGGRALDVGCGAGRVCVALATAFPDADIIGLDPDGESVAQAKAAAKAAGIDDHTRFLAQTTGEIERGAGFDLITACDCIHDFVRPVATLKEIHALLKPEGTLFIMEPKVADRLEDNRNAMATMFYGFSVFHCMTQSLAEGGPGLGTCLGPTRTEGLVREAGFGQFKRLDIKSQAYLFYAAGR
jgi:2-polyprenyl-3-methyl-5-hydroxy-6-metoxy-1,4-benzoquinol methylase